MQFVLKTGVQLSNTEITQYFYSKLIKTINHAYLILYFRDKRL